MWQHFVAVTWAWVAAAGLAAGADRLPGRVWEPTAEQCASEIVTLHGVWHGEQVFLPAYADLELVRYLAGLGAREPGVAVIAVYAADAVYFRSQNVVFLSTGFILRAGSEGALREAIGRAPFGVRSGELAACAGMAVPAPASFADVVGRLGRAVAEYERLTARRLRRRE